MSVLINVHWAKRPRDKKQRVPAYTIKSWINHTLGYHPQHHLQSLALRFIHNDEMQTMNKHYRDKDYPTNVLTFAYPLDSTARWHADIAIAPDVVAQQAEQAQKSFYAHCAHMVIHGTLHALGHDHEKPKEAKIMESLEEFLLSQLCLEKAS